MSGGDTGDRLVAVNEVLLYYNKLITIEEEGDSSMQDVKMTNHRNRKE